jgi:hypothetical protein
VQVAEEHGERPMVMLVGRVGDMYQKDCGTVPEDLIEVQMPELT